jgi:HK97 gp10 family phage protein
MAKSDIQIEGLDGVLKQLDGAPKDALARLRPVVEKHTQAMFTKATADVPVRDGILKGSIKAEIAEGAVWVFGRVRAAAPHAHLIEYGTVRAPEQPFLRPAYEAVKAAFQNDATKALAG